MTQFGDKLIDRLVKYCYDPDMTGEEYRKMTDQKQVYRFKYSDLIIAERQYPWVDRVLILRTRDRTVMMDMRFSDLALGNWELVTPQGDNSES